MADACRLRQMQALLAEIKEDKNAVVLAGDLNTTSSDNTPTSISNEIMIRVTDYQFWIGQAVSYFHPLGTLKYALYPLRYFHGYNDRQRSIFRSYGTTGSALYSRTWRGFASATIMHSTFEASLSVRFRPAVGAWRTATSAHGRVSPLATLSAETLVDWSDVSSLTGCL